MTMLWPIPRPVIAPVAGGDWYPVRRIFCVGRNYAAHAREMGRDPDREPPFFFTKWAETLVHDGATIPYPSATADFQYEAELVVAIGKAGRSISSAHALNYVFGYAVGLDMTRRDLQLEAREKGRPWDTGKNVEASSPVGLIHPVSEVGHLTRGVIRLSCSGTVRQKADLADLIWPVSDVISVLSDLYRLEPGDLIFTGTPAGVGPVCVGESLFVEIDGLTPLRILVGPPS